MNIREIVASAVSAAIFLSLPVMAELMLSSESDAPSSWQRGVIAIPLIFVAAVPIALASARYLLRKGFSAFRRFVLGAFSLAGLLSMVLLAPTIVIGSYAELFTVGDAIRGGATAVLFASLYSVPASIIWWLIAGNTHNNALNTD